MEKPQKNKSRGRNREGLESEKSIEFLTIRQMTKPEARKMGVRHLQLRDVSARDAPESSRDCTVFNPKLKVQAAKSCSE